MGKNAGRSSLNIPFNSAAKYNINLKLVFLILIFVVTVYVSNPVVEGRGF